MSAALVFVLLAQAGAVPRGPEGGELLSAAAASPRPRECTGTSPHGAERTVWDRARRPRLATFCDSLAQGYARLAQAPSEAQRAAQRAEKALPGRAAPLVLEARALVALGRDADAWKLFGDARKRDRRSVETPGALHALAVAAVRTKNQAEAVRAYRALAPRAGLLGDGFERQRVYVEAAATVMTVGEGGLDEAIGYLAEARRRRSRPGFGDYVLGTLALALDRQGRNEEARGVAAEAGGPWYLERASAAPEADPKARTLAPNARPVLPDGELDAIVAMLAEREAPELARERWQAFLDGPAGKGPWAEHAKRKLAALRTAKPKRGR